MSELPIIHCSLSGTGVGTSTPDRLVGKVVTVSHAYLPPFIQLLSYPNTYSASILLYERYNVLLLFTCLEVVSDLR